MEFEIFESLCAGIGMILSWFIGDLDSFIRVLVAFVAIDYITGITAAYITHTLNSNIGFHGIARKCIIFLIVGVGNIVDTEILSKILGHTELCRDSLVFFYLGNEGISILENAIKIGIPFPQQFKDKFMMWVEGEGIKHNDN